MSTSSSTPEVAAKPDERTQWFMQEVAPHGDGLKSYLRKSYPAVRDVDDVVQESLLRVWQTKAKEEILSAKSFLYRVGQRLSLDAMRKQKYRQGPVVDFAELNVVQEGLDAADAASLQEKLKLLADGLMTLSDRNRQIIVMCKIQRMKRREVSDVLGIQPSTIDEHLGRALKHLHAYFQSRGIDGFFGK